MGRRTEQHSTSNLNRWDCGCVPFFQRRKQHQLKQLERQGSRERLRGDRGASANSEVRETRGSVEDLPVNTGQWDQQRRSRAKDRGQTEAGPPTPKPNCKIVLKLQKKNFTSVLEDLPRMHFCSSSNDTDNIFCLQTVSLFDLFSEKSSLFSLRCSLAQLLFPPYFPLRVPQVSHQSADSGFEDREYQGVVTEDSGSDAVQGVEDGFHTPTDLGKLVQGSFNMRPTSC